MAINSPVDGTGILEKFETLVTDVVNSNILWGINNLPFPEMPTTNYSLESTILGQQNLTNAGAVTVNVPSGANALHIISAVGGGSGGVGGANYDKAGGESAGAGGASGAYISDKVFSVAEGETLTFTVGDGGAGTIPTVYNISSTPGGTTSISGTSSGSLFSLTGGASSSGTGGGVHGPVRTNTAGSGGTATINTGIVLTSASFVDTDGTTRNINTLNGGPIGQFDQSGNGVSGTNPGNCTPDDCTIGGGNGGASFNGNISGGAGGVNGSDPGDNGDRGSGGGGGGAQPGASSGGTGGIGEIRYRFLAVT